MRRIPECVLRLGPGIDRLPNLLATPRLSFEIPVAVAGASYAGPPPGRSDAVSA